jgi:hypothetical protein
MQQQKERLASLRIPLEQWLKRNGDHDSTIINAGRTANFIVDAPATISVATWAYSHAAQLGAGAWASGNVVEPLSGRWRMLLDAHKTTRQ